MVLYAIMNEESISNYQTTSITTTLENEKYNCIQLQTMALHFQLQPM